MTVLLIALGGALGAVARYALGGLVHSFAGPDFPWGTLVVNVLGSLLLGFSFRYLEASALSAEFRSFLVIGLIGAFTTFSTFSYETAAMLQDGEWSRAGLYMGGSVLLSLTAVLAGFALAAFTLPPRG